MWLLASNNNLKDFETSNTQTIRKREKQEGGGEERKKFKIQFFFKKINHLD